MRAKKIKPTIVPEVGMHIVYDELGGNRPTTPLKITFVDGTSLKGRRRGAIRTSTIDFKTLGKFRLATPEEIAANPVDDDGYEPGDPAVSTSAPRAVNDTPPSEPPPPAPAANDAAPSPGSTSLDLKILEFFQKRHEESVRELKEQVERQEQARREDFKTIHETVANLALIVNSVASRAATPPVAPAPLPAPTKAAERDARDQKMTSEHMVIFKDLVPVFVQEELELVDIRDPAQMSSVLQAKDVLAMFHAWCAKGSRSDVVCYQHAFYNLLKKIHDFRADKKKGVFTPWVRKNKRQVSLDFSGVEAGIRRDADAKEILDYARRHLWSDANDTALPLIVTLLESDRFTKDNILGGLAWLHGKFEKDGGLAGSKRRYSPQEVFLPGAMKSLVDAAREKGGAK